MCSGSEAGSYLRLIDFMYHSTLGLRVIKKKTERGMRAARRPRLRAARFSRLFITMNRLHDTVWSFFWPRDTVWLLWSRQCWSRDTVWLRQCWFGLVNALLRAARFSRHFITMNRLHRETSLLVRIHFIIVMSRWTGLAPWEFESASRGSSSP